MTSVPTALCLAAAAVAGLGGCCKEPPLAATSAHAVLLTEAPAGGGAGPSPADRYPLGSRVLRLDTSAPGVAPAVLSEGLCAAGGAVASHDGARVLFVGKRQPEDAYTVWTCGLDGARLRKAADGPGDCQAADFLPDGRIVFSAALAAPPAYELFVAAEGETAERITFAGGTALDPAVLGDGRIVYAASQSADDLGGGGHALFTVHPDGTGAAALHGQGGDERERALPRQGPLGDVVFLARPPDGAVRVEILDWRAPAEAARVLESPSGDPRAAAPASGGGWLVATRAGGLRLVGPDASDTEFYHPADGREIVQVSAATPRRRPQGHLSSIKPGTPYGTLLGIDARPAGSERAARVRLWTAARAAGEVALGDVTLAADGSFHVRVPPDTPLALEVLDAAGRVLSGTRTPFWVRPREVRGCVGCHEPSDVAPPNHAPLAALAPPVELHGSTRGTER